MAGYYYPTRRSAPNKVRFEVTPENYAMILKEMSGETEEGEATETSTTETSTTETTTAAAAESATQDTSDEYILPIEEGVQWVVMDPMELESMFINLEKTLEDVGKDYECAYKLGRYNVPNLRFGTKINKVKKFSAQINKIIKRSEIKLARINSLALGQTYINDKMVIDQIWAQNILDEWFQMEQAQETCTKKIRLMM